MSGFIQCRDGLPPELTEEKRFFELYGSGKTDTPAGWNEPENWKYLDEIPEEKNFGFAIGRDSNYLLIDGDHVIRTNPETGKTQYADWVLKVVKRLRAIAPTYTEVSMSGTGFHMIVDLGDFGDNFEVESNSDIQKIVAMDIEKYRNLPEEERNKTPKIELFYHSRGRYVYLTGKHSGETQRVLRGEKAALFFSELLKIREEFHAKYSEADYNIRDLELDDNAGKLDATTRERALLALPYISANERETWIRIGIALSNSGFDMSVFDEWSKWKDQRNGIKCTKYKPEEIPKIWKSFRNTKSRWNVGTIFLQAKLNGWNNNRTEGGQDQGQAPALPVKLSNIEKKKPEWLVPGYIPLNAITLAAADGGAGKTSIETSITAAVSSGTRPFLLGFPTLAEKERGETGSGADVLFLSGEDFASYTLREKIETAGGDIERVFIVDPTNPNIKQYCIGGDLLRKAIEEVDPRLVVIDPLQSFLPENVNMIARNQMRQALIPLAKLAEEKNLSVLIAVHSNKRDAASGRNRVSDSSDIWDMARSVLMVGMTGEGNIRYVSHEKSNWGALSKTALFRIGKGGIVEFLRYEDKKDADYQCEKRTQRTQERDAPKRKDAEEFILDVLKDAEENTLSAGDLKSMANDEGISSATYRQARKMLEKNNQIRRQPEGRGKGKGVKVYYQLADGFNVNALELDPAADTLSDRPDTEGQLEEKPL